MRTIAQLQKRKSIFKRLADRAKYDRTRRFYAREVYRCDEDIALLVKQRARQVAVAAFLFVILLLSQGCHTVEGVGKDLQDWSSPYTERD